MTLHRAIVALPTLLCAPGVPVTEMVVFFEATEGGAYRRLLALADANWRIATSCWGDLCFVQELYSEFAVVSASEGGAHTGDLRLLELGTSHFDTRGPRYATADETILWVEPRMHCRLLAALRAASTLRAPGVSA